MPYASYTLYLLCLMPLIPYASYALYLLCLIQYLLYLMPFTNRIKLHMNKQPFHVK